MDEAGVRPARRRMLVHLLAGGVTGLFGVVLFGVAHALAIVPIWDRLSRGVPFGFLAGLAMGWALLELRAAGFCYGRPWSGLAFGGVLWMALLPMTIMTVVLREAGFHRPGSDWEVVGSLALTSGAGLAAGWLMTQRRRAALSLSVASTALAVAQAGPVPATNGIPAATLFFALAVLYPTCGLMLTWLVQAASRVWLRTADDA